MDRWLVLRGITLLSVRYRANGHLDALQLKQKSDFELREHTHSGANHGQTTVFRRGAAGPHRPKPEGQAGDGNTKEHRAEGEARRGGRSEGRDEVPGCGRRRQGGGTGEGQGGFGRGEGGSGETAPRHAGRAGSLGGQECHRDDERLRVERGKARTREGQRRSREKARGEGAGDGRCRIFTVCPQ